MGAPVLVLQPEQAEAQGASELLSHPRLFGLPAVSPLLYVFTRRLLE